MEKIVTEIEQWAFLQQLPAKIAGFTLKKEMSVHETEYFIFSYENAARRRRFSVIYDHDTKDFMVVVVIGLTEYRDMFFIVTSLISLEKVLQEKMESTIKNLAVFNPASLGSVFNNKKIINWAYQNKLQQEIAGFTLFIKPNEPIRGINGSYIIIDYSDFESESNLVIFYNVFRDEFFGEIRIHRTPQMTNMFDTKDLSELAEKLDEKLMGTLKEMRRQV
jgi:hypothetical protein